MSFQHFRTEETNLMLNDPESGKLRHIPVKIHYSYDYETDPIEVDFGSEKENQDYIARFSRGELVNVLVKVTAQALGETGSDYLGACHEKAQGLESGILETAIQHDMKNNACIELKNNILCTYKIMLKEIGGRELQ